MNNNNKTTETLVYHLNLETPTFWKGTLSPKKLRRYKFVKDELPSKAIYVRIYSYYHKREKVRIVQQIKVVHRQPHGHVLQGRHIDYVNTFNESLSKLLTKINIKYKRLMFLIETNINKKNWHVIIIE